MQTSKQLGSKWCVQVSMMISLRLLPLRRGQGGVGGGRKEGTTFSLQPPSVSAGDWFQHPFRPSRIPKSVDA